MTYADLIKKYIQESGLTLSEIADRLKEYGFGLDKGYISRLQNGKTNPPSTKLATAIAYITGKDADSLLNAIIEFKYNNIVSDIMPVEKMSAQKLIESLGIQMGQLEINPVEKQRSLPVIGVVKAGPNGLAYEEFFGNESVEESSINGGEYFWLKVKGESMIGDGILAGDLALVRVQPEVNDGELAIVIVDGEEGTLKRVYQKSGTIILQSSNPNYPPRVFSGKQLNKIRIVGKVKEIKRKL